MQVYEREALALYGMYDIFAKCIATGTIIEIIIAGYFGTQLILHNMRNKLRARPPFLGANCGTGRIVGNISFSHLTWSLRDFFPRFLAHMRL